MPVSQSGTSNLRMTYAFRSIWFTIDAFKLLQLQELLCITDHILNTFSMFWTLAALHHWGEAIVKSACSKTIGINFMTVSLVHIWVVFTAQFGTSKACVWRVAASQARRRPHQMLVSTVHLLDEPGFSFSRSLSVQGDVRVSVCAYLQPKNNITMQHSFLDAPALQGFDKSAYKKATVSPFYLQFWQWQRKNDLWRAAGIAPILAANFFILI